MVTTLRRRAAAVATLVVITSAGLMAGIDGKKAMYVGGTVPGLPENVEGRLDTSSELALVFIPDKKGIAPASIAWGAITDLEYGQKAGRRVGVAVAVSPLALFSKKRNHYLTMAYLNATTGKEEACVLELGKDIVRTTLKIIETRSGKPLKFQDDEARKQLGGGK